MLKKILYLSGSHKILEEVFYNHEWVTDARTNHLTPAGHACCVHVHMGVITQAWLSIYN